jgi:hypothetical protein
MRPRNKPPDAQTTAALHQLAKCFWQSAVQVVEKRMDAEDHARQQPPLQRVKLLKPYVATHGRFNAVTTPRAAAIRPRHKIQWVCE